jgi:NAD(P)-dependent dehydrogenase (short-subunit alcohol dehydrogenase family)
MKRVRLVQATMGPRAQPNEIAAAISWLASEEASTINGATLAADSGGSVA